MEREPIVAGRFYSGDKAGLEREVARYLDHKVTPKKAIGCAAPHAGYIYSGAVAGEVFASVEVPPRCIVLSPKHTRAGARAAVWAKGSWSIPTGRIPVDEALAASFLEKCPDCTADAAAHLGEHSLEVELPFLLARQPKLSIVPVALGHMGSDLCERIGTGLAAAVRASKEEVLLVASTDMNHYETQERTLKKDGLAIDRILALDAPGLLSVCEEHGITMCGVVPTAVLIVAAKKLGATKATLVRHATSGDVSGDLDEVVGYAGFLFA